MTEYTTSYIAMLCCIIFFKKKLPEKVKECFTSGYYYELQNILEKNKYLYSITTEENITNWMNKELYKSAQ